MPLRPAVGMRPSVRRDRPGAVTRAKPHDLGKRCGRALARGVDKHRARSKVLRAVAPQLRYMFRRHIGQNGAKRLGSDRSLGGSHGRRRRHLYCDADALRVRVRPAPALPPWSFFCSLRASAALPAPHPRCLAWLRVAGWTPSGGGPSLCQSFLRDERRVGCGKFAYELRFIVDVLM